MEVLAQDARLGTMPDVTPDAMFDVPDQSPNISLNRIMRSGLGMKALAFAASVGIGIGANALRPDVSSADAAPLHGDSIAHSASSSMAAELPSTVTLTLPGAETVDGGSSTVSAQDVASGQVTILSYIRANGLPKKYINKDNCFWKDGVYNSGETINGPVHPKNANQVSWFWDPRETYVCHVPKSLSPTGLAKAGNKGPNGQLVDDCGNFVETTPPKKTIQGRVLLVKNALKAKLHLEASAFAEAVGHDQNGNVCGIAEATASSSVSAGLRAYVKSKGAAAIKLYGKVFGKAQAKASAEVTCSPGTPPPPPPPPPPHVPPAHGCEVSNILEKDGRTDNLTITTDSGADIPLQETIDWGDGQTSTYAGTSSQQTEYHFYNNDATYTETVTETFADGGTATCTGVVTTQQESAPPPPPA